MSRVDANQSTSHQYSDVEEHHRRQYYEVLDVVLAALAERFQDNPSTTVLNRMEQLLLKAANGADDLNLDNDLEWLENYDEIKVLPYQINVV